ncbi:MAG TPA: metallophosphoesterase, partial [Bacteroidota bacterium]|nr:metallophosphoesterase [Bacteroidota bacterium]
MQILALTDIHGSYETMESIIKAEPAADVIVLGGDITTNGNSSEMNEALRRARYFGKRVLAVCGNMDPFPLDDVIKKAGVSINAKGVVIGDVGFFGVSAAPSSFLRTPNEISEAEIEGRAKNGWVDVASARWKIFVPHAPPSNTSLDKTFFGKHVGSTSVRTFIETRQPDVVICGHIHEARGEDAIDKSKIVNC